MGGATGTAKQPMPGALSHRCPPSPLNFSPNSLGEHHGQSKGDRTSGCAWIGTSGFDLGWMPADRLALSLFAYPVTSREVIFTDARIGVLADFLRRINCEAL